MRIIALPTATAAALRAGAPDANGQPARALGPSSGAGTPCRHCLAQVPAGQNYLLAAHRPFATLQPYAESGPIFLCAGDCAPGGDAWPQAMLAAPAYIVRAYDAEERIVDGSGAVVPTPDIPARCQALLAQAGTAFVHVRSASNNCFFFRIER